jgi:phage gp29-like protein
MHQARFTFMQPEGTASETPRLLTGAEPLYGETLAPARFVVHRHRGRSTSTVRAGVMRPCAWMYLFKNYTLKDWAVFGERYAQPMRVGKFSPGASEADRAVLKEAVFNLGSDAAAIISESTVIELLETAGRGASADVYERFAAFCDRAVSKAVLGQTLTTEQQGGAYATARVHDAVRRDLLEADSLALAYTLRESVAAPLVAFNFGPGRAVPRVSFRHEERADLGELARTYQSLAGMGVEVPGSFIRERFGIPAPEGADARKA